MHVFRNEANTPSWWWSLERILWCRIWSTRNTPLLHTTPHDLSAPTSKSNPKRLYLLGDDLFSAPKASWSSQSFSNPNLRHLWHSSDSNRLWLLGMLWSTSYSKSLPAVPNTTAHSFHSDPSPNTPSKGCSKTFASSEGSSETSSDSAPSDLNSAPMFFRDSLSHSRDSVAPAASNIKGRVAKVICDIKGQGWSGLVGNAGRWPWSWLV